MYYLTTGWRYTILQKKLFKYAYYHSTAKYFRMLSSLFYTLKAPADAVVSA